MQRFNNANWSLIRIENPTTTLSRPRNNFRVTNCPKLASDTRGFQVTGDSRKIYVMSPKTRSYLDIFSRRHFSKVSNSSVYDCSYPFRWKSMQFAVMHALRNATLCECVEIQHSPFHVAKSSEVQPGPPTSQSWIRRRN